MYCAPSALLVASGNPEGLSDDVEVLDPFTPVVDGEDPRVAEERSERA